MLHIIASTFLLLLTYGWRHAARSASPQIPQFLSLQLRGRSAIFLNHNFPPPEVGVVFFYQL
ncbi:MAG: hypothetical protein EBE86_003775 [Hormoscilla sp. GUM202]|nr:hypothetical protein [Hormoscilla sp. GUM202]MBO1346562.1 hypothetical protein [Hormoscilla sp. GUM202]